MSKKKIAGIIVCIVIVVAIVGVVLNRPTPTPYKPEFTEFTTYTDEEGLFSISYPSDWALALEQIEELERLTNDVLNSIVSDIPLEEVCTLFLAGLPAETGFNLNVNIVVEPRPEGWTLDEVVAAEIRGTKEVVSDYRELSRVKTIIYYRTAVILEFQAEVEGAGTFHFLMMFYFVDNTIWIVGCTTSPDEFGKWEDVFDYIVRSLRVLR